MPVLKKSSKARMGKGRGKLSGYCGTIGRGAYLFEFATNPNIIMNRLIHRFRHQLGNIFIVITANNTIKFSK
jgi:ribosomal protein L16/L10AE